MAESRESATYPLPNASVDLSRQTALVTGASAGLGERFSRVLAAAGARVALVGRRRDRLEALAREIGAAGGIAAPFVLDVGDAAAIPATIDAVEAALGRVSILVNNAGIAGAQRATTIPLALIDEVIAINLRAPFVLAREVASRLIAARAPGRIVNISSMATFNCGMGEIALYASTKAGLARMTEALAVEWAAQGITVNAIAPGMFQSDMTDGVRARIGDAFIAAYPKQRLAHPALLDSTLLYLVAPASEAVTGTVIKVDDGQLPR